MNYGQKPDIKSYLNWGHPPDMPICVIACDQQKFNFTRLVFPAIEEHGLGIVPVAFALSLDYMDKVTRSALMTLPRNFMNYWRATDDPDLALVSQMPKGYMQVMQDQADEIQARMVRDEGNVKFVQFGRAA